MALTRAQALATLAGEVAPIAKAFAAGDYDGGWKLLEADELVAILTASIKTAKQRDVTSCAEARSWRTRDGEEPGSWWPFAPTE